MKSKFPILLSALLVVPLHARAAEHDAVPDTQAATNVPAKVVRELAQHLSVAPAVLRQCLGPQLAGSKSFSSVRPPNAPGTETWESAVRSLTVSADEKRRLLAFQTGEDAS